MSIEYYFKISLGSTPDSLTRWERSLFCCLRRFIISFCHPLSLSFSTWDHTEVSLISKEGSVCFTSSAMVAMRSYNHACHMAGWGSSAVTASGSSLGIIEGMRREFILWTFTLPPPRKPHKVFSPFLQRSAANWLLAQSRCSPGHIFLSVVEFSLEIILSSSPRPETWKQKDFWTPRWAPCLPKPREPSWTASVSTRPHSWEREDGRPSHFQSWLRSPTPCICSSLSPRLDHTWWHDARRDVWRNDKYPITQDQEESRACLLFPSWLPDAAPTFPLLSSRW